MNREEILNIIKEPMAKLAKEKGQQLEEYGDAYGFDYPDTCAIFIEVNDTYDKPFVAGVEDFHIAAEEREDFDTIEEAIEWCRNRYEYIEDSN